MITIVASWHAPQESAPVPTALFDPKPPAGQPQAHPPYSDDDAPSSCTQGTVHTLERPGKPQQILCTYRSTFHFR